MNLMGSMHRLALIALSMALPAFLGTDVARADKSKPKPQPGVFELQEFSFGIQNPPITSSVDGSTGPRVSVHGYLHLLSQAFVNDRGEPVAYTLHADVSDAFASTLDSSQSFAVVGSSDGIPAECQPVSCPPPFWSVTFRLIPQGSQPQSSLLLDLTVNTQYDGNGTLANACIVGQPGCAVITFVP
jgi:hypothetical protein